MKDYQLNKFNLDGFMRDIQEELESEPNLVISSQSAGTGKWGMSKIWWGWMGSTADWMAGHGCTMPLIIKPDGSYYGSRPYNKNDAFEFFTAQWMGVDTDGLRLSWSRSGRDGMRPATKAERYFAMMKHENWAVEKGITLFKPRDSEYARMEEGQNE